MNHHDWSQLKSRAVSAAEAVRSIPNGARAFMHGGAATPTPSVLASAARPDLEGSRLYHVHTGGPAPFLEPACEGRIRSVSLFTGGAARGPVAEGRADFMPVFLSDIPYLFQTRRIPL
ncbi:hypothetical protein OY671_011789, partial [Metschnikowia pulcherrima]